MSESPWDTPAESWSRSHEPQWWQPHPVVDTGVHETITGAARELFTRHGYEGVSLRDVARHARVTPANITASFGNKARLYVSVIDHAGLGASQDVPLADLGEYFVAAIVHRYRTGEPEHWIQSMRYIEHASAKDAPRLVFDRRIQQTLTRRLGDNVDGRRRTRMLVALLIGLAETLRTAGMLDGSSTTSFEEFVESYSSMAQDLVTPPT